MRTNASKSGVTAFWDDFWPSWDVLGASEGLLGDFGGHLGSEICAPVHAGVCLVKSHVFDVDRLSRRVLD